jgi:hypothetical protein
VTADAFFGIPTKNQQKSTNNEAIKQLKEP